MNTNQLFKSKTRLIRVLKVTGLLVAALVIASLTQQPRAGLAQPPIPRIYAQYTDDHIRFEYTAPGAEVTFSIYASQVDVEPIWSESRMADEAGLAMVSIWEHRLELWPGMFIVVSDGATAKELLLETLSLDVFDPDENIMSGKAKSGREVWVVANNDPEFCGVLVTADGNGDWSVDFDDQGCELFDAMGSYAQVMDGEDDTTEVFVDFIDGWHDYDTGEVPHWACNAGGWAVDTDDRDRDLSIRILADGEAEDNVVATTVADGQTDLFGICGSDGTCGYEVNLWDAISPYEAHQIFVQALDEETGQWVNLNGTPRPLTCRTYDIYIFNTLTGETRQLTDLRDSWEFNPRWSQDGKQIVHDRWDLDFNNLGVHITDVGTGTSTPLAGAENGNYPIWSPNGQWIAFNQGEDLYVLPPSGGEPTLVRSDAFMASWAPNSQRLVVEQPSDGSIHTIDRFGNEASLVVEQGHGPAWSPNGQWIAYELDGDVWKIRVDIFGNPLGDPVQLTDEAGWEGRPSWDNNSHTIAFHKGFDRDTDIWTIPAAGGMPGWLTGAPGFADYDPNYSNNGRYLAYASFSPNGQAARSWIAAYTYDLPAGSLAEGIYPYHFEFEWTSPEPGTFSGQGGEFVVSSAASLYDGCVLLRGFRELGGVDTSDGLVCEEVSEIHPNQPARFLIGWLTDMEMTYSEAQAHFDSLTARAVWGDDSSGELMRHVIYPSPYPDWASYVCSFTRKLDLQLVMPRLAFGSDAQLYLPVLQ